MKLKIEIKMDNAAFEDNPREVADLLEDLARRCADGIGLVLSPGDSAPIHDSNGNNVGEWRVTR